jgi:hypothetical protein
MNQSPFWSKDEKKSDLWWYTPNILDKPMGKIRKSDTVWIWACYFDKRDSGCANTDEEAKQEILKRWYK